MARYAATFVFVKEFAAEDAHAAEEQALIFAHSDPFCVENAVELTETGSGLAVELVED